MIYRGMKMSSTENTSSIGRHSNATDLLQTDLDASEEAGPLEYVPVASTLDTDARAAALAEATASSLPSPREHLESVFASEQSSPPAPARSVSGSSASAQINDSYEDYPEDIRSVAPPASPRIEDWHFEPEALFSQVYVPVRDFEKLNEQRLDLVTIHVRARESRKILRAQRTMVLERQSNLLQNLRALILKGGKRDLDHLLLELDKIEKLNDSLQTAEENFDQLEADLIEREWELKGAELRLYRKDTGLASDLDSEQAWKESKDGIYSDTAVNSSIPGATARSAQVSSPNPPMRSEIDMLRTRIRELELEHQQLMQEESLRKQVGLSLDDDSSFALRTFSVRHTELVQHVERYEERLEEKQHILSSPIILDTSFDQFPAYQYTGDDLEVLSRQYTPNGIHESTAPWSDELTLSLQDSPRARDKLLLPIKLLDDVETIPSPFAQFAVSEDHGWPPNLVYINDWLLYMLRSSSLEILYFRFCIDTTFAEKAMLSTKELILSLWYKDDNYVLYIESTKRAAESLDPTVRSRFNDLSPTPALSFPNLARWSAQISLKNHSRSMFAHRDEVKDLTSKVQGLLLNE